MRELGEVLKAGSGDLVGKAKKLVAQLRDKEKELEALKLKMASGAKDEAQVRTIQGIKVHVQRADGIDMAGLRSLADQLREKVPTCVIALGGASDGKVSLFVVVKGDKELLSKLKANDLIKEMAVEVDGTGGGRPEMAQAGGKNPERLDAALAKVFELVERAISKT